MGEPDQKTTGEKIENTKMEERGVVFSQKAIPLRGKKRNDPPRGGIAGGDQSVPKNKAVTAC